MAAVSDLQCPATFYVLAPDADAVEPPVGRDDERIALVWTVPARTDLAHRLADEFGCAVREHDGLAANVRATLEELSDLHRGESAVVLPAAAYAPPGSDHGPTGWLRVRLDADGVAFG